LRSRSGLNELCQLTDRSPSEERDGSSFRMAKDEHLFGPRVLCAERTRDLALGHLEPALLADLRSL